MILICLGINPVGDCSEMAVLGFRLSLLVIIIIIIANNYFETSYNLCTIVVREVI